MNILDEYLDELIAYRNQGLSYSRISEEMYNKYGIERSKSQYCKFIINNFGYHKTLHEKLDEITEELINMNDLQLGYKEIIYTLEKVYNIKLSYPTLCEWFISRTGGNIKGKVTQMDNLWDLQEYLVDWIYVKKMPTERVLDELYFKFDILIGNSALGSWKKEYKQYLEEIEYD